LSRLKQIAEKVRNCSAMEWHSRGGTEKTPTSQALGIYSGFLTSFGMTSKCIFPPTVKAASS
jgi:hypothetical protein